MILSEPGATLFGSKFASRGLPRFARGFPDLADRLAGAHTSPEHFATDLVVRLDRALRGNDRDELLLASVQAMSEVLAGVARAVFLEGLVEDAMRASKGRMSESRVRIIWGTTPIINLIPCARAARTLGLESESLVFATYQVTDEFDIVLASQEEWVATRGKELVVAYRWLVFAWAMLAYDVFFYFNDAGILWPRGGYGSDWGINLEEMQLLKGAAKRFYTLAYGADYRTRKKTMSAAKYNFCMDCPDVGKFCVCDDEAAAKMFDEIRKFATATCGFNLSLDFLPKPQKLNYLVLDTDRITPSYTEPSKERPLRIAHSPNHEYFKGTQYLRTAIDRLKAEGHSLELVVTSNVTNQQVLELYRSVDLVADQFIGGSYGYAAIEAMALGKPVISYVNERILAQQAEGFPVIIADPEALYDCLKSILAEPAKLASLARQSRQYVERCHSLPAFAEQLRWLLRETASLPHAITARLVKSRGAMGWMARQLARDPALFEAARRFYRRVPSSWLRGASMTYRRVRLVLFWAPRLLRELVAQTLFLPAYWPIVKNGRSSASPTRSVVMLVISDARVDPRVERGARALAEAGFEVKVLYPDGKPRHAEKPIDWGPRISFRPLPARVAYFVLVFPWLFQRTILRAALEERPGFFHCHDLNTSLIGLAAARRVGARCVCDFHEWFSENVSLNLRRRQWRPHSKLHRAVLRWAEQVVMNQADEVITVCDSIADELSREFSGGNRKVQVVRNIPRAKASSKIYPSLRESLGVRAEEFILLWQGGTGPTRMIEPIIEALAFAPKAVFVIRGQSLEAYGTGYRKLAEDKGVDQRLVLLDPVPSADVVAAARGADAGIWTLPNLCKNFQYALPNKLFEYLAAELPVLVADYPEARRIIEEYEVGLCFDPYDPKSIAAQLNALISDPMRATVFRSNTKRALTDLDPNREWAKLVTIYNELCEVAA